MSETTSSLARKYNVSWPTMKCWLRKIGFEKPKTGGAIYSPKEVKEIIKMLGEYEEVSAKSN